MVNEVVEYDISCANAQDRIRQLVDMLNGGEIVIPDFQRQYVWDMAGASRLIESIILGLPIPAIFFAKTYDGKLSVIDGQQRLKTIQYFVNGIFGETGKRKFKLLNTETKIYDGKDFQSLSDEIQRHILNFTLTTTVITQRSPKKDDTSIYRIFERLNTGGKKLNPQEVRIAVAHNGFIINTLKKLTENPIWKELFPYPDRQKRFADQELILRFMALYCFGAEYTAPMKPFLDISCKRFDNRDEWPEHKLDEVSSLFKKSIENIFESVGKNSFIQKKTFNNSFFEAMTLILAKKIAEGSPLFKSCTKKFHEKLHKSREFQETLKSALATKSLKERINQATKIYDDISKEEKEKRALHNIIEA